MIKNLSIAFVVASAASTSHAQIRPNQAVPEIAFTQSCEEICEIFEEGPLAVFETDLPPSHFELCLADAMTDFGAAPYKYSYLEETVLVTFSASFVRSMGIRIIPNGETYLALPYTPRGDIDERLVSSTGTCLGQTKLEDE